VAAGDGQGFAGGAGRGFGRGARILRMRRRERRGKRGEKQRDGADERGGMWEQAFQRCFPCVSSRCASEIRARRG
jgi:hypothetical protein